METDTMENNTTDGKAIHRTEEEEDSGMAMPGRSACVNIKSQ